MKKWGVGKGHLVVISGDLTKFDTQAIVNAANSRLAGGGGVDGAIHRAAGPGLLESCQQWVRANGDLPAGQAMITPGFNLDAKYVIHTVGPIWRGGGEDEEATLKSAYESCLNLAAENGIRTIAFPAVSCGVYGFPIEKAIPIALGAMAEALKKDRISESLMVLHGFDSYKIWSDTAETLFGPPQ